MNYRYVQNARDAAVIAAILEPFSLKVKSPLSWEQPGWFSSIEEPLFTQSFASGFTRTKGKWIVEGCRIYDSGSAAGDTAGVKYPEKQDGTGRSHTPCVQGPGIQRNLAAEGII